MEFKVGDKVRAYLHDSDDGEHVEITTTVIKISDSSNLLSQIMVEWPGHNNISQPGWWIYKDADRAIAKCDGYGKVICKNVKRFKD